MHLERYISLIEILISFDEFKYSEINHLWQLIKKFRIIIKYFYVICKFGNDSRFYNNDDWKQQKRSLDSVFKISSIYNYFGFNMRSNFTNSLEFISRIKQNCILWHSWLIWNLVIFYILDIQRWYNSAIYNWADANYLIW